MHLVVDGRSRRQYLALGRLDHWAVPLLNQGTAVFTLDLEPGLDAVDGRLAVQVKANAVAAGSLLRLAQPVLLDHVANRIERDLEDARRHLRAVLPPPRPPCRPPPPPRRRQAQVALPVGGQRPRAAAARFVPRAHSWQARP